MNGSIRLILPSVQVNIRANQLSPAEYNGTTYLKVTINQLKTQALNAPVVIQNIARELTIINAVQSPIVFGIAHRQLLLVQHFPLVLVIC